MFRSTAHTNLYMLLFCEFGNDVQDSLGTLLLIDLVKSINEYAEAFVTAVQQVQKKVIGFSKRPVVIWRFWEHQILEIGDWGKKVLVT